MHIKIKFAQACNCTTLHKTLMTELRNISDTIKSFNEDDLLHVIMYSNKNLDNMNIRILTMTIRFIKDSERSEQPLF